jgi:hypothetical protein
LAASSDRPALDTIAGISTRKMPTTLLQFVI